MPIVTVHDKASGALPVGTVEVDVTPDPSDATFSLEIERTADVEAQAPEQTIYRVELLVSPTGRVADLRPWKTREVTGGPRTRLQRLTGGGTVSVPAGVTVGEFGWPGKAGRNGERVPDVPGLVRVRVTSLRACATSIRAGTKPPVRGLGLAEFPLNPRTTVARCVDGLRDLFKRVT